MLTLRLFNIIFLTGILTSLSPCISAKNNNTKDTQTIIYLLDHISMDYSIGIKDGIVLNEVEYAEMQEFSKIVYNLSDKMTLPTKEKTLLLSHILNLQKLIHNKETFIEIDSVVKFLKKAIIKATGYKTTLAAGVHTNGGQKVNTEKGDSSDYHLKIASNYLIN